MKKFLLSLAGLLLLTGCVPVDSLNPLYTEKDIAFDESLVGSWVGSDNGAEGVLEFIAHDEDGSKGYLLMMTDKYKQSDSYKKAIYQAHLIKLNDRLFLDVTPQTFETSSHSYPLQVTSGKSGTTIEPALLRLGEAAYLEFSSATGAGGKIDVHLQRAHWIIKVSRKDNMLQLDWPDDEDFRNAVQAGTVKLSSKVLGNGLGKEVVITASTLELQKFVVEHADSDAFSIEKPVRSIARNDP